MWVAVENETNDNSYTCTMSISCSSSNYSIISPLVSSDGRMVRAYPDLLRLLLELLLLRRVGHLPDSIRRRRSRRCGRRFFRRPSCIRRSGGQGFLLQTALSVNKTRLFFFQLRTSVMEGNKFTASAAIVHVVVGAKGNIQKLFYVGKLLK